MKNLLITLFLLLMSLTALAAPPSSTHVVIVLEENTNYSSVVGNTNMPYFNSLVNQYALAQQYFANTHPSIGNYFELTTGQILTNDDSFTGTVTADNVARQLLTTGETFKAYAESLPYAGYTGTDVYPYVLHHNPLAYFSDVRNSSSKDQMIVPLTQLATDLANGTLPNYSFVVPNMHDNMHDCPAGMSTCTFTDKAKAADAWLQTNIAPLLADPNFMKDGVLIITWDESSNDNTLGGGRVATVIAGPNVKTGYKSTVTYQHQNTLRMMLASLGVTSFPGASATANDMTEFFTTAPIEYSSVITQPVGGSQIYNTNYVVIQATANGPSGVLRMDVWIDYKKAHTFWNTNSISYSQWFQRGQKHRIVVQAQDSTGKSWNSLPVYITVN